MRDETFTVADGFLVRRVITNGRQYQHRCPLAINERTGRKTSFASAAKLRRPAREAS